MLPYTQIMEMIICYHSEAGDNQRLIWFMSEVCVGTTRLLKGYHIKQQPIWGIPSQSRGQDFAFPL